ncbi:hypothetical protein JCM10212_001637 [Sporobolomyces blumeae]
MTSPKSILVVGATGKQGSAVVRSLVALGHPASDISFLTRNPSSPAAVKLEQKGCKPVQGSLSDVESLKRALEGKDAVFLVTTIPPKDEPVEEEQGRNLISAATAVEPAPFVVFTSVADASPSCGIPHFESKARVEESLKDSGLGWCILRPVAFYDNLPKASGIGEMMGLGLFDAALRGKKLQMVACDDIGHFAARALLDPEKYSKRVIPLAGDELTMEEARAAYCKVENKSPWLVWKAWVPRYALWLLPYDMRMMFYFFHNKGYSVNIPEVKAEHAELLSFEDWLHKPDEE